MNDRRTQFFWRIKNMAIAVLSAALPAVAMAGDIFFAMPNAKIFDSTSKIYVTNELVAGNIEYITDKKSEGYHPQKLITVNGRLSQKIYDHPSNTSALLIFSNMRAELQRKRFEIIHECDGAMCGDLDAWRLYLTPRIAGSVASQHYILAKRIESQSLTHYIQFYTVDIGAKPRSVLSIVSESAPPSLGLSINAGSALSSAVSSPIASGASQIHFEAGSAQLSDKAKSSIKAIAEKVRVEKINQIEVAGYTDDRGGKNSNRLLAEQRANVVVTELKAQPGLESLRVVSVAKGAAEPLATNASSEGRAANRRVSVKCLSDVALISTAGSSR